MRTRYSLLPLLTIAALTDIGAAIPAFATQKFGPLELSGNLSTAQIVRHPDVDKFQFIQQRNTMKVRVDWRWLQRGGKWLDRFDLSELIESSSSCAWCAIGRDGPKWSRCSAVLAWSTSIDLHTAAGSARS